LSDKSIFDWFGKRKEATVTDGTRDHAIAILDAVSELKNALKCMENGDVAAALKGAERLILSEREADRMEDRLCAEISRGELSVQEREDLISFVRKAHKIANWAKEAGIHMQLVVETSTSVPKDMWSELGKMTGELITEVKFLVAAIESIMANQKETLRNVDAIYDQERIIDGCYFSAIKHAHLSDMDPKAVLLVTEMINSIEMAADSGKSCADTIEILIVSRGI